MMTDPKGVDRIPFYRFQQALFDTTHTKETVPIIQVLNGFSKGLKQKSVFFVVFHRRCFLLLVLSLKCLVEQIIPSLFNKRLSCFLFSLVFLFFPLFSLGESNLSNTNLPQKQRNLRQNIIETIASDNLNRLRK